MSKILAIILVLSVFLLSNKNIAVLDFSGKGGVSADEASIVADTLRSDLVASRVYKVLDRGNMERILKEQSFQKSGCTDSFCAVEIGKLLNMHIMVVGNISKLGRLYSLSVEMISVESGEIIKTARETARSIEEMFDISKEIVERLTSKKKKRSAKKKRKRSKKTFSLPKDYFKYDPSTVYKTLFYYINHLLNRRPSF